MSIHNRELNHRLSMLQRCAEIAPVGTYTEAKEADAAIEEAIESVREIMRIHGFKVNGADPCRNLEVAIYEYLLISNPEAYGLITAESFGEHIDGPNGGRIMAQTKANLEFFKQRGLLK